MDPSASMPRSICPQSQVTYTTNTMSCVPFILSRVTPPPPHTRGRFESSLPAGPYRTDTGKAAPEGPGDRRLGPLRCATLGRHEAPTTEQLQPRTRSQATEPEGDCPRSAAGEKY